MEKISDPGQKKFGSGIWGKHPGSATLDFITQRNITLNEAKR
jgi:hypothetical protein